MKLTKLSLAAVLAAGSFSFANAAVSVEDAIKDVKLSGYARYRGEGERVVTTAGKTETVGTNTNDNKFRVRVKAEATFDEYFSGNFGLSFDAKDTNKTDVGSNFDGGKVTVRQANIVYHNKDIDTTVIGGRQEVANLYVSDIMADGIIVANESAPGLKVSAFYLANLDSTDRYLDIAADKDGKNVDPYQQVFGLGVEGKYDIVNFGLWAAQSYKFATVVGLDTKFNIAVGDDMGVGIIAQVSQTMMDSKFKPDTKKSFDGYENSTNYNVSASFDAGFADVKVGYAANGNKDGESTATLHDSGAFDTVGEILMNFDKAKGQRQFIYATLGAKLDKFSAGFDYVNMTQDLKDADEKIKANEFVGRLGYQHSKKLGFKAYYAYAKADNADHVKDNKEETNKFRVEAKYSF